MDEVPLIALLTALSSFALAFCAHMRASRCRTIDVCGIKIERDVIDVEPPV